jgi:hypothetical protein
MSVAPPQVENKTAPAAPAPAATPPTGTLVTIIGDFNRIMKKMVCDLVILYPQDATIDRAKKRVLLAIDLYPICIIEAVGPYLFAYKEGVYAGDTDFFLENDYDLELAEAVNTDKADLVHYIIPKIKTSWRESDAPRREAYKESTQTLLDIYLDFLALRLSR